MGRVPKIRFKGFEGEWEETRFSDIATTRRGLTYKPEDISENGIRVLRSSNINEDHFEIHNDDVFVDVESVNIPFINNGDILITSANGSNRLVGKHAIIRGITTNSTVHGGFMLAASARNPQFVNALMSSPWYTRFINIYVAGGNGAIGNLNKNDLDAQLVNAPSDSEQKSIGEIFYRLDQSVDFYQRKLAETQTLKQYLLRNMFPAPGEAVPAIRFEGFEGEWEQKKLSQLLSFSNGYNGSKDSYGSGIPYISVMDILENDYITYDVIRNKVNVDETTASRFLVFYGDVLFQRSSENVEDAGKSNVYLDEERPALFGGFVIRGKKIADYDPLFMKRNLETVSVRHQMQATAQGAQHINISQETLSEIRAYFPSLEEQQRIGTFFAELDENINYTKQKITALNTLKQYLLQNMFPTKG